MTATTIKVSPETRDRLKAQAARADISLGAYLSRLADAGDRQLRFEAMRAAIARTSADELDSYERESREWLDADLGAGPSAD